MDRVAIAYLADGDDDRSLEGLEVVRGDSLESVLERIGAGEFSTLVVAQLRAIARSLRELVVLLDWLDGIGATLVAVDVGLDTSSAAGLLTVAALREIARWEHEPGLGGPRGRPGLAAQAPELTRRITELRERGLSLQAIADALNADGVPTPRGGMRWRPSSVQAALGYRRPPPGPPLPPHGPKGRGAPRPPAPPPSDRSRAHERGPPKVHRPPRP